MFIKTLFTFISLILCADKISSDIIFINEEEIVNSFPDYRELKKKLEQKALQYKNGEQALISLTKSKANQLAALKKDIETQSKKDISKSAGALQRLEQATQKAQKELNAKREELIVIQKEGAALDVAMNKWGIGYSKKAQKALNEIITQNPHIRLVIGWPSGRILYIKPSLNHTKDVLSIIH